MGAWLQNVYDSKGSLALPARQEKCKRSENCFFIQYFPTSETALLFERFAGIRGILRGENPKCTEKNLSHCHDVNLTWTDLVTNKGLRDKRLAINRSSHGKAQD